MKYQVCRTVGVLFNLLRKRHFKLFDFTVETLSPVYLK